MIKKNMPCLTGFLVLCFFARPSFAGDCETPLKKWHSCEQNNNCILVEGACSTPVAVNKEFSEKEEKRQRCLSTVLECAKPPVGYDEIEYVARCEKQKCIVRQK